MFQHQTGKAFLGGWFESVFKRESPVPSLSRSVSVRWPWHWRNILNIAFTNSTLVVPAQTISFTVLQYSQYCPNSTLVTFPTNIFHSVTSANRLLCNTSLLSQNNNSNTRTHFQSFAVFCAMFQMNICVAWTFCTRSKLQYFSANTLLISSTQFSVSSWRVRCSIAALHCYNFAVFFYAGCSKENIHCLPLSKVRIKSGNLWFYSFIVAFSLTTAATRASARATFSNFQNFLGRSMMSLFECYTSAYYLCCDVFSLDLAKSFQDYIFYGVHIFLFIMCVECINLWICSHVCLANTVCICECLSSFLSYTKNAMVFVRHMQHLLVY